MKRPREEEENPNLEQPDEDDFHLSTSSDHGPISSVCEICKNVIAKYRCPRCSLMTCSVVCVKEHKENSVCDGIRDPTAFVDLAHFTEMTLRSDLNFLVGFEKDLKEKKKKFHSLKRRKFNNDRMKGRFYRESFVPEFNEFENDEKVDDGSIKDETGIIIHIDDILKQDENLMDEFNAHIDNFDQLKANIDNLEEDK